jgi:hypothetical protein
MNGWNERGCGSENFGTRITKIGFTVEKLGYLKFEGANCNF